MKFLYISFLILASCHAMAQKIDSINVPKRVVYKYCAPNVLENAKKIIRQELSDSVSYQLDNGIVFIGPTLWSRYKKIPALEAIPGGNTTILYNNEKLIAKITQDKEGFKKIWDQLRSETKASQLSIRKANYNELDYYWSVIAFDIEEPLLIAETSEHRFILNLSPKDLKLIWLDEVPANIK